MNLPTIYPITDTRISEFSLAEQVERFIEGGATIIQLREKYASPNKFFEGAKKALEIARRHEVKIIINDRVDIVLALKADGVHLGQTDLPPEKARKILGEKAIVGFSTHNLEQAVKASKLPIDYLAIGPIFTTQTKENPEKSVGVEGVKSVREAVGDFPIVAIGGVNSDNYREVLQAGADSVAVINYLLSNPDKIFEKMRKLQF